MTSFIHGESLYTLTTESNWGILNNNNLIAEAEKLGGHLACISNEEENNALYNYYSNLYNNSPSSYSYIPTGTHNLGLAIGFSDAKKEGEWQWSSGEKAEYLNWTTGSNHPDQNGDTAVNSAQLMISVPLDQSANSKWNDTTGDPQGIIEIPLQLSVEVQQFSKNEGTFDVNYSIQVSTSSAASMSLLEGKEIYWTIEGITKTGFSYFSQAPQGLLDSEGKNLSIESFEYLLEENLSDQGLKISIFFRPNS